MKALYWDSKENGSEFGETWDSTVVSQGLTYIPIKDLRMVVRKESTRGHRGEKKI